MENQNYLSKASGSAFPLSVDPLLFVQDASIKSDSFRQSYDGKTTDVITNNQLFTPINATLFNTICDRIRALQKYLLEKEDCMVRIEFGDEPTEYVDGKTWLKER